MTLTLCGEGKGHLRDQLLRLGDTGGDPSATLDPSHRPEFEGHGLRTTSPQHHPGPLAQADYGGELKKSPGILSLDTF